MRVWTHVLPAVAALVLFAGCAAPAAVLDESGTFRVRTDVSAGLDADAGWAAPEGEPARVTADRPFRVRFEAGPRPGARLAVQVRRNDGPWADLEAADFPYPETATPRASVVSTDAYAPGAATADVLSGSSRPFRPGVGLGLEAASPPWSGVEGAHGEWEVPVVVRRFADGAVTNEPGDTFGFRLVEAGGRPVSATATVVLEVEPGHLGGTFVETPGRIGPWQASNGDLYFVMEPTETDNVMMVVKSSDGGATWREVDGANRPRADDLEGVGADLEGATLHVLHQTSDHVWRHTFRTSDHPEAPDTWAVTDESVAAPGNPPTQVASLVARPGGGLVAAYGGLETVLVKVRSADGTWGPETAVDPGGPVESGPHLALGDGLEVHLAYTDGDGAAWYRRVQADGSLTSPVQLATGLGTAEEDVGAIAPLVVLEDGAVVVVYRLADGGLWERRVEGETVSEPVRVTDRVVVQNAVDSEQVGADAVAVGDAVHVLFVEDGTGHLYHAVSRERGEWDTRLIADDVRAQWVRGQVQTRLDGTRVYKAVLDAGSDGGAGMNRYLEVELGD